MCLDDAKEVAAALPLPQPVVITETPGIRVEFSGGAGTEFDDALRLLINECVKHAKPIASVDYRFERPKGSDPFAQIGVLTARWAE
jgi:hypothetical protein